MKLGKPALGAACNGCGACCIAEPCALSVDHFGLIDRCPALEQAGERYACGLVTNPGRHLGFAEFGDAYVGRLFGELLGIGRGCDADDLPLSTPSPMPEAEIENEGTER